MTFSPDSRTVAYVWLDHLGTFSLLYPPVSSGMTAHVVWADVAEPQRRRRVRIDAVIIGLNGDDIEGKVRLVFSPDSRHLAVLSPRRSVMIELRSGRHWALAEEGEQVSSLAWLDSDEIAYAAHTGHSSRHDEHEEKGSTRTFWRQKVHDAPAKRKVICRDESKFSLLGWRHLERWSPTGRYVVFCRGGWLGPRMLLDVTTGSTRTIGRGTGAISNVSWKPDGSAVFCLYHTPVTEQTRKWEALLLDPATGKVTDFSARFEEAFGDGFASLAFVDPAWTPDGTYLLAEVDFRPGTLIGLEPWEVIPIAERMSEELDLGYTLHIRTLRDEAGNVVSRSSERQRNRPTNFCALPIAGWLRAEGLERQYLVDYTGCRTVALDNGQFWGCSPDGKLGAIVDRWTGRITLDPLSLPLRDEGATQAPIPRITSAQGDQVR